MLPDTVINFIEKALNPNPYKQGYKCLCPFHSENTPSFYIFQSDKDAYYYYHCFGCKRSGPLSRLLRLLHAPIPDATLVGLEPIWQQGNTPGKIAIPDVTVFREDITTNMYDHFEYFIERGVARSVAMHFKFKMVYGDYPAAVMPVYTDHRYVGFVKRFLAPEKNRSKYQLQKGSDFTSALWAFDDCNPMKTTIVTEGIIDAACWWTRGYQAVALVTGKQWRHKTKYLSKLTCPLYVPDNGDPHSLDTFYNIHKQFPGALCFIPRRYKDTSDFVTSGGQLDSLVLQ